MSEISEELLDSLKESHEKVLADKNTQINDLKKLVTDLTATNTSLNNKINELAGAGEVLAKGEDLMAEAGAKLAEADDLIKAGIEEGQAVIRNEAMLELATALGGKEVIKATT